MTNFSMVLFSIRKISRPTDDFALINVYARGRTGDHSVC